MSIQEVYNKENVSVGVFFFLLYLYLVLSFFTIDPEEGGGWINQVSAGLLIAYCTLYVFFSTKTINPKGIGVYKVAFWFLIYLLVRFVIMYLMDPGVAISSIRNEITILFWVVGLLFGIQKYSEISSAKLHGFIAVLIVIAIIVSLRAIYVERAYLHFFSKIGAVNGAGSAYMLVPIILLALKGKTKLFAYILCLVICAWSQKRQALLGFGCVSVFVLYDIAKEYFSSFKFVGIVLLFLAIVFSGPIINSVFSGFIERQQYLSEKDEVADNGRAQIWTWSLEGYLEAPMPELIFGGGPGTGGRYVEKKTGGWFVMPHNAYIEILCDYGVIGLGFFIAFFISLIKLAYKYPRGSLYRKILFCIILSWMATNVVSHAGRIWLLYYCIAIGLIISDEQKAASYLQSNMLSWYND